MFRPNIKLAFSALLLVVCLVKLSESATDNCLIVKSNYNAKGVMVEVNGLKIYESRDKTPTRLIFVVYDIFGYSDNNNIRQVADKVAQAGFRIAMPDFLGKKQSPFDRGTLDNAKIILKDLIPRYKAEGVKEFGIFGFCWGGLVSVEACSEFDDIKAGALVHPARVQTNHANSLKSPMFLMPSRSEPDMIPFYNIMETKFGKDKIGHHRFEDVGHGFAGAGSNFDDKLTKTRVVQVIQLLRKYFNERLSN